MLNKDLILKDKEINTIKERIVDLLVIKTLMMRNVSFNKFDDNYIKVNNEINLLKIRRMELIDNINYKNIGK